MPENHAAELDWRKSSFSGLNGCVEVARTASGDIVLRDSKNPDAGHHTYTPREWAAFARGMQAGEFEYLLG
ncbi:DUF397 domain-containing protein [Kineosporia succinea]|uniref:DUF397 domain-containing protein n=1 Tax=Kineosporia succinea TaxID=84632 RepID=A0ABT9PCQ4_9ACTN|nr:DUF397 domain-containing protein [Kineosporia succinea]MDP9830484.1 hypothetical protein [Kineosporia succinea]